MKKSLTALATTGILASCAMMATTANAAVPDSPKAWEKCAGVSKAGKNDCGSLDGSHACAGYSKGDNLDTEWVYLPKGACGKLTGGIVAGEKSAK